MGSLEMSATQGSFIQGAGDFLRPVGGTLQEGGQRERNFMILKATSCEQLSERRSFLSLHLSQVLVSDFIAMR